jgi:hypothetical protein
MKNITIYSNDYGLTNIMERFNILNVRFANALIRNIWTLSDVFQIEVLKYFLVYFRFTDGRRIQVISLS